MDVEIRRAFPKDWPLVRPFFERHYREGHPFRCEEFWNWQTADPGESGAFVAIGNDAVVGHTAFNFGGGWTWGLMMMVDPAWRNRGLFTRLLAALVSVGPLAVTNSNDLATRLLKRAGWHQYPDLVRYVAVRPQTGAGDLVGPVAVTGERPSPDGHYWRQPGIHGVRLRQGTAVAQPMVGGLRAVDLDDPASFLEEAWDLGYRWVDYLTSLNDPILGRLVRPQWVPDEESMVPWQLDPVSPGSRAHIRVMSPSPLPYDLAIRRTYSDHGRVGSLPSKSGA